MSSARTMGTFLTAAVVFAGLPGAAAAQDVKLRIADSFPAGHWIPEAATKYWMDEVTRMTDKAVTFEYYPAEQLGKAKELLSLAQSGVADIAYVAPTYVSDKMPLSAVATLPMGFGTACEGTKAYWKLVQKGGILEKKEFAPNGMHMLFAFVLSPYQVFTASRKIETPRSLDGLKLRSGGGAMDLMERKLGAVPVQMAAPDVYMALSRGTLDGLVFPTSSIFSYNLGDYVKYSTVGQNFGSFVVTYVISEKRWKTLPAKVQAAMTKAGEATVQRACEAADSNEAKEIDRLKKAGATMVQLSANDKDLVTGLMADVGNDWAATLDKRGKPGTEVLKAFQEALK